LVFESSNLIKGRKMGFFKTAVFVLLSYLSSSLAFVSTRPAFASATLSSAYQKMAPALSAAPVYTDPDQPARFAKAKEDKNERFLDITTVYDPAFLKGKRVAITGANRGIGLALAKELVEAGGELIALVRSSSPELEALNPAETVKGIDVSNDEQCEGIASQITGGPIDILINNAGYFLEALETLDSLNFPEQIKTIDICACGPLRVSSSLINGGLMKEGSKVIMITSQGGSVGWRTTQNPTGHDYGHHMSKAAANMASVLLAQEVKSKGIIVGVFHPGFNKTGMTAKYAHIWEVEGAVDASVGAKRIFYETDHLSMETTGKFINCEDGLEIPW
jgi:NAD(P)-dependent dehydrogenase (short-subunit alcohol dehydrogenase family)